MKTPGLLETLGSILGIVILGALMYLIITLVAGVLKFFLIAGLVIITAVIIYRYFRSLLKKK